MQRNLAGECEKNDQRNASVITLAEPLFSLAIPGPPICLLFVLFKPFYSKMYTSVGFKLVSFVCKRAR